MDYRDKAQDISEGEGPDPTGVAAFLRGSFPDLKGNITIRRFPSGYSNLTYLLTIGDTELVLRRPPFGTKAKTAHDMGREYGILKALHQVFPYCPRPLAYTEDTTIIGCPFYVMERMRGIILRRDLPPGLVIKPAQMKKLCEKLLDVHFELHSIDFKAVGLANFGKPEGYVRRQVEGWSQRYRAARTDDAPDSEEVMAWISNKMPPDTDSPGIIHNDYKLDNLVLDEHDPTKIIGVLDWEMATIGDPLMDLGNSLAYWIQRDDPPEVQAISTVPTNLEGAPSRKEMLQRYFDKSGRPVDNFDFYYCFGLFRLAVIAQQIYYRYYHGQTKDERFKTLIFAVQVLEKAAREVMEKSHL
jgi:aminoglycoside phosphotransferase (APT) family kinase protein